MTLYQQNVGYNVESVTRSREYLKRKNTEREKNEKKQLIISMIITAVIFAILLFLRR